VAALRPEAEEALKNAAPKFACSNPTQQSSCQQMRQRAEREERQRLERYAKQRLYAAHARDAETELAEKSRLAELARRKLDAALRGESEAD
jgi:hypothetical protein